MIMESTEMPCIASGDCRHLETLCHMRFYRNIAIADFFFKNFGPSGVLKCYILCQTDYVINK